MADSIPDFAMLPPRSNNDVNRQQPTDNNDNRNKDIVAPFLPMWAVVLIVVFLLALFVSITCIYFHCKRKLKKRKMKKNRAILQSNQQTYSHTIQDPSFWRDGWTNAGYDEEGTFRSFNNHGQQNGHDWMQKSFNNPSDRSNYQQNTVKNNHTSSNCGETLKRKAPAPPVLSSPEPTYENFASNATLPNTPVRKAPPPPGKENPRDAKSCVSQPSTINDIPAIMKEAQQELVQETLQSNHPTMRSREIENSSLILDDATNATTFASQSDDDEDRKVKDAENSSEVLTSEDSIPAATDAQTDDDEQNAEENSDNNLIGILTQWKEHLFAQKNELQDYYNRLTGYVESVVIQPNDSVSNVGVGSDVETKPQIQKSDKRKKSKKRRKPILSYPAPPESILNEVNCIPDSIEGQQQVINNLRTRLTELEQLLQNTNELNEEPEYESAKRTALLEPKFRKSIRLQSFKKIEPKPRSFQTLPIQAPVPLPKPRQVHSTTISRKFSIKRSERITMQKLLAQLDRPEGERLLKKIAQIQDTAKQHADKMTLSGVKEQLTSKRLARQIHNVMRDVIHPKLQTNMFLATQAACNLTSKLAKVLHKEDKDKLENTEEAISICDRITGLVRHMLDMTKQLELRIDSYYKDDFHRFIEAFLNNSTKILNVTQRYVCLSIKQSKETVESQYRFPSFKSSNLMNDETAQLSNGLTKLEHLLKSGKLPGFESSAPPSGYHASGHAKNLPSFTEGSYSGSCDSDCETYSYTSCSTCFPSVYEMEKTQRNPYLFPGDRVAKTMPNEGLPLSEYDQMRPSTRPNAQKRKPTVERFNFDAEDKRTKRPENIYYPAEVLYNNNEANQHEVMLAKYLNELLKTQNENPAMLLPHDLNVLNDYKKIKKQQTAPDHKAKELKQKIKKEAKKSSGSKNKKDGMSKTKEKVSKTTKVSSRLQRQSSKSTRKDEKQKHKSENKVKTQIVKDNKTEFSNPDENDKNDEQRDKKVNDEASLPEKTQFIEGIDKNDIDCNKEDDTIDKNMKNDVIDNNTENSAIDKTHTQEKILNENTDTTINNLIYSQETQNQDNNMTSNASESYSHSFAKPISVSENDLLIDKSNGAQLPFNDEHILDTKYLGQSQSSSEEDNNNISCHKNEVIQTDIMSTIDDESNILDTNNPYEMNHSSMLSQDQLSDKSNPLHLEEDKIDELGSDITFSIFPKPDQPTTANNVDSRFADPSFIHEPDFNDRDPVLLPTITDEITPSTEIQKVIQESEPGVDSRLQDESLENEFENALTYKPGKSLEGFSTPTENVFKSNSEIEGSLKSFNSL